MPGSSRAEPTGLRAALVQAYYSTQGIDAFGAWREFEERQWWPRERYEEYVQARLRETLAFASRECSYYRQRGCTAELDSFPALSKLQIMDHLKALEVANLRDKSCFVGTTSGTSGIKFAVLCDRAERVARLASSWRGDGFPALPGSAAYDPWSLTVMLWGHTRIVKGGWQRFSEPLYERLFQRHVLDCFQTDAPRLKRYYDTIRALQPRRLIGYVAALSAMARLGLETGLEPLKLEKVVPTAEQLDDATAAQLARFFHGPQRQRYGCREAGDIAHHCEYGHWHLHTDSLYPEVRRADGSIARTGRGTLLLTKLVTRVMPIIRYDIEDIVSISDTQCPCGRSLPVLDSIEGRWIDQLVDSEGNLVNGLSVPRVLRDIEYYEFQCVQDKPGECMLLLVPARQFDSGQLRRIEQAWREFIGEKISVRVELVQEIAREASGKKRQVLNRIPRA